MFVPKAAVGPISPSAPNITFRCTSSSTPQLQAQLPAIMFSRDPPSPTIYIDVNIATDPNWQASLSFNLSPFVGAEPYAHFVNGTRVPGVFLGREGSTRWFYKYNWGGNAGEYYLLRWLKQGGRVNGTGVGKGREKRQFPVLDDRDWTGYLRVVGEGV